MTLSDQEEPWGDAPVELPPEILQYVREACVANQRERLRLELLEAQRRLDFVIQLLSDGTAYDEEDDG